MTGGKKYSQKQAKKYGVDEVVFDKDSRAEYLTGFHKRKLQRQKNAQVYIKEQERLARIQERKLLRDERKKDLETQLGKFNDAVKDITNYKDSDDEDWGGFDENAADGSSGEDDGDHDGDNTVPDQPRGILHHKEVYKLAEDALPEAGHAIIADETTVTVESLDNPVVSGIQAAKLEAVARANNVNLKKSDEVLEESIKRAKNYAVVCGVTKPVDKKKNKKFRYLTKTERRENNRKAKANKMKSRKKE